MVTKYHWSWAWEMSLYKLCAWLMTPTVNSLVWKESLRKLFWKDISVCSRWRIIFLCFITIERAFTILFPYYWDRIYLLHTCLKLKILKRLLAYILQRKTCQIETWNTYLSKNAYPHCACLHIVLHNIFTVFTKNF